MYKIFVKYDSAFYDRWLCTRPECKNSVINGESFCYVDSPNYYVIDMLRVESWAR
jgi:hypothetical protein